MNTCFFVSDLHGMISRYEKLVRKIKTERPEFVFIGGDLLPHKSIQGRTGFEQVEDFGRDVILKKFRKLKEVMACHYPKVYLIPGNDDRKDQLNAIGTGEEEQLWTNLNMRTVVAGKYRFIGYAYVPPTPFRLKDWEKYDVSRYVDPGCLSPLEGVRTAEADGDPEWDTIAKDLEALTRNTDLSNSVFLFHSPPYQCLLDRAALDGRMVDHVPMDVHVGSIAIQRFIQEKQPWITLHGHIHESARLTGAWRERFGRTFAFNAAHDGDELALLVFELQNPELAERYLV